MVKLKSGRVGDDEKRHFGGKKEKGRSGSGRIEFIPKTGGMSVRFLTDSSEWQWYEEYWDTALNKFELATEENEDDYAERGIRSSIRYLAAAVKLENNQVIAVKIPYGLAQDIKHLETNKWEKKQLRLNEYDVELSREGEGTDTEYRAVFEGADDLDVSRYQVPDLFKILLDQIDPQENNADAIDDDEGDEEEVEAPKKSFKLRKG